MRQREAKLARQSVSVFTILLYEVDSAIDNSIACFTFHWTGPTP